MRERELMLQVLSLFSGIGAYEKALENMGANFSLVGYSEIDKFASKSYAAIHGIDETLNLGDVSTIDTYPLKIKGVNFIS
jgi:DNA (cytosine-5)-methyltransferase 1